MLQGSLNIHRFTGLFALIPKMSRVLLYLQDVKENIDKLHGPVERALAHREEMVMASRPLESHRVQETASLLCNNWEKLNKLYKDRLK